MSTDDRGQWAEQAVVAVGGAFPTSSVVEWPMCSRLLPHVAVCYRWINEYAIYISEAAALLDEAGWFLLQQVRAAEAHPYLVEALRIRETYFSSESLAMTKSLRSMGGLYLIEGNIHRAVEFLKRALKIGKTAKLPAYELAGIFDSLGAAYRDLKETDKAIGAATEAIELLSSELGPDHPELLSSLSNLASFHRDMGRYAKAEELFQRIGESTKDPKYSVYVAAPLNQLAMMYAVTDRLPEARDLLERAAGLLEVNFGVEHPDIARALTNLAQVCERQGDLIQAEQYFQRALVLRDAYHPLGHELTIKSVLDIAAFYADQNKWEQVATVSRTLVKHGNEAVRPVSDQTLYALLSIAGKLFHCGNESDASSLLETATSLEPNWEEKLQQWRMR